MTDRNAPIVEDELHLYVDGELAADRRDAVEAWLLGHPEDAARVAAWRAQAEAIRTRFGAVASEPVPARLTVERIVRKRRSWMTVAAAATIAAFAVGGIAGWVVRGASAAAPSAFELLTADAATAHQLYVAEVRHPFEVSAGEDHLLPWLSRRIGTSIRAPDLGSFGLKLLGGRLLPGPEGPAAQFMYENGAGERYTFYCARLNEPQSAFRYGVADKSASVRWVESDLGYVLSGPADRDELGKMAQSAYAQLENKTSANERSSADQLMSRRGS